MSWQLAWSDFASKIRRSRTCTLGQAAAYAVESWPELASFVASLELPATRVPESFVAFVEAVESDLAAESRENATDEQFATAGEFYESVARQMSLVLARDPHLAAASPFDTATGLRSPYTVATLLAAASFFLRSVAQWYGEPVGRAGEGRRQFDPADFGNGVYPWSSP